MAGVREFDHTRVIDETAHCASHVGALYDDGARRDAALQASVGQLNAALGVVDGLLRDAQQAVVGGVGQPSLGDVGHEDQPRRSGGVFGGEIPLPGGLG